MMPLDRNESYWLLDTNLLKKLNVSKLSTISTYPEYVDLKKALAAYCNVSPEDILLTAGSDSAIEYIVRTYVGEGGTAILPVPTFYGYESILARAHANTIPLYYGEHDGNFVFPLEKTITAFADSSVKALFLCHPNNPLGCPLSPTTISELLLAAQGRGALIVSDEAYFEFSSGTTFLSQRKKFPNLIVIRTLSKSFGLSGARVGYAIASPEIVKELEQQILPWPIAHTSVAASLALLARSQKVEERRRILMATREQFMRALLTIPGITVYPSETNFILIRLNKNAARIRDALLDQGIRVALGESMSRFPDSKVLLKDTLRIAIPSPENLPVFMACFAQTLLNS